MMTRAYYYIGAMDINVVYEPATNTVALISPDLNIDIRVSKDKLWTQGLSAVIPAIRRKDNGHQFVCGKVILDLFEWAQEEPDLLAKIVAVTEAHLALKGRK